MTERKTSKKWGVIRIAAIIILSLILVWINLSLKITAGNIVGTVMFGSVLVCVIFWGAFKRLLVRLWSKLLGKIILCLLGAGVAAVIGICTFFSVNMVLCMDRPMQTVNCVLVLGCQVRGEIPTYQLQDRLNAAIEVLDTHPDSMCIVSGGQENGEAITEAEAMRRFLEARGISPERIFKEESSSSTEENIRFSKRILDEHGITDGVMIVTSDYHQYRANIYARQNGIDTGHCSARTSLRRLANSWVREWAALFFV